MWFEEFAFIVAKLETGQRAYLNFNADPRFGSNRVGALYLPTSRFIVALDPALADEYRTPSAGGKGGT